jgi:hypothetical protein
VFAVLGSHRPVEHRRNVLEQLEPTVERTAFDQVESDVWISLEETVLPSGAGDDREDDHTDAVHQAGSEQRPAQTDAADGAQGSLIAPLHVLHNLDASPSTSCYYRAAEWGHKDIELAAHDLLQYLDNSRR